MVRCASCGQENPSVARFCLACGTAVMAASPEQRRQATILFCDLSGSTALGERIDPEASRAFMLRYFAEMRAAVERHGSTVEKFIGDAVMAVFGAPLAHEDDALRAARAASEMQARTAALNAELQPRFGVTVGIRVGVNTGEAVSGGATTRQAVVSGDPVNVAGRLEQLADVGHVLLGVDTYRLVRHAVRAEPVEPRPAKGKTAPVPAFPLLDVRADATTRGPARSGPLAGRDADLETLRHLYETVVRTRQARRVTIPVAAQQLRDRSPVVLGASDRAGGRVWSRQRRDLARTAVDAAANVRRVLDAASVAA